MLVLIITSNHADDLHTHFNAQFWIMDRNRGLPSKPTIFLPDFLKVLLFLNAMNRTVKSFLASVRMTGNIC